MKRHLIRRILALQNVSGSGSSAPAPAAVAPTITSSATFSVAEGQTAVGTITATGDAPMVYSITGGADAAHFAVNSSTGALTFGAAKNYESPADANADNAYQATVQAANGVSPAATQNITATVTNIADVVPIVTAAQSFDVDEDASNGTTVGTVLVTAGDSAVDDFEITSGNTGSVLAISDTGVITKVDTLDHGTTSSYTLAVRAHNDAGWGSSVNVAVAVNEASAWPTAVSFTPNATATHNSMSVPAYLTPTADAKFAQTSLLRVSDNSTFFQPSSGTYTNFGPVYPLRHHFNADDTICIVDAVNVNSLGNEESHFLNTASHLVNASTGAYIKPCRTSGAGLTRQWRWSNSNPDLIYYVVGGETVLRSYVPSTDTFGTVKDFAAHGYVSGSIAMYGGDGDASDDDRYHAFNGSKSGGQWYVAVWDKQTDTILCEIPVAGDAALNLATDAFGMSKSGTYLWIKCNTAYTFGGSSRPAGVAFFDRSGNYLRSCTSERGATNTRSHCNAALDSAGNDVWLHFGSVFGTDNPSDNSRTFNSYRMDGTGNTNAAGIVQLGEGYSVGLYYFSSAKPGWAIWSDMAQPTGNSGWEQYPTRGHIFAIKLDQSGGIYPICESRISTVDWTPYDQAEYNLLPWAVSNRGMTKVLFKSAMSLNWSGGIPTTFHAYFASAA